MTIRAVLARSPVIPVLTIEDAAMATDLAGALIAGGLPVIEITLRTEAGLEAVSRVAKAFPEASVGVGTVLDEADFARARDAGAVFAVSPGLVPEMAGAANAAGIAFLPGVQTSSEIMTARRLGLDTLKFFPAEASGGVYGLKQFAPVYPDVVFCPTGGLTLQNAPDYLACPNVICIGGGMATPADALAAQDWDAIRRTAAVAAGLTRTCLAAA